MIFFTKYADNKFEILNKHKVFYTKEQIEDVVRVPEKTSRIKKLFSAEKSNIKVVYKKEGNVYKIITFYPIKISI